MKRQVRVVLASFSIIGFLIFQTIYPASTIAAPSCSISGDGSASSPWLVRSSVDLQCFESGTWTPPSASIGYVSLLADVVKINSFKLFKDSTEITINFQGNSHTITISGVTDFMGLFQNSRNSVFEDFNVQISGASSLKIPGAGTPGYGWVVAQDYSSTFDNIQISAPISNGNGGIIGLAYGSYVKNSSSSGTIGTNYAGGLVQSTQPGASPAQTRIENSYSTGLIGATSGGILGVAKSDTKITRSYSTGLIDNGGAGGLAGGSVVPTGSGQLLIESSYSTGNIGFSSGGILGAYSLNFAISNVYSTGNVVDYAGGIVGANASDGGVYNSYVLGNILPGGEGIYSRTRSANPNLTSLNVYVVDNLGWSDVTAASTLTGYQGWGGSYKWVQCTINTPAKITAFYTRDPCAPEPTPEPTPDPTSTSSPTSTNTVATAAPTLAKTGVSGFKLNLISGIAMGALVFGIFTIKFAKNKRISN